ncbi:MAG: DUF1801 domain-containing protein [Leucobacter sp.]
MSTKEPAMRPTGETVADVLDRAKGPRRSEVDELLALHQEITGVEPVVWAGRIIGFGEYEYHYDSGHSGRAPLLAFAPGAARHAVYLTTGFSELWPDLLQDLGTYRASKACLYLTRLSGVDRGALQTLLERSLAHTLEQLA